MRTLIDRSSYRENSRRHTQRSTPLILCVDDDPDIQTTIELRLREYDVEIEQTYYGMQGITQALDTVPDLILLDVAMPNGNGEYLLECMKRNPTTVDIPIVVLTGMRDPTLKTRLLQGGASIFLHKPIHFDALLHQMSRFIDIRKLESDETT